MVIVVLLVAFGSTAPSADARGEGPPISELRSRIRPTFALAPAFSLLSWEGEPAFGAGGIFEAGLILNDRIALSLHLEGLLVPSAPGDFKPRGLVLLGGPTLDWFFDDRWSVGAGLLGGAPVGAGGGAFTVPLRVSWRFMPRDELSRARSSVMIGLQAAPGIHLGGFGSVSGIAFFGSGMLTVGFGWW